MPVCADEPSRVIRREFWLKANGSRRLPEYRNLLEAMRRSTMLAGALC